MRWIAVPLLLLPAVALAQTDDRSFLTAFLEERLSDAGRTVTVTGFAGALSSRATIQELTIADAQGIWITLRGVTLDWTRSALLSGNLSVNTLTADEIILDRPPVTDDGLPSPEARGFALPELPVSINIGTIGADRIVVGEAVFGAAIEGRLDASMSLAGGEGMARLLLERTDDGPDGQISLNASYANATQALSINLDAVESPGGIAGRLLGIPGDPSLDLSIVGDGTLADFTAEIGLASNGADRLSGEVRLSQSDAGAQAFVADVRGDIAPLFLPQYAEFFGSEVTLQTQGMTRAGGGLDLRGLKIATQSLQLDGSLVTDADGLPSKFSLIGSLASPDGTPVLLPLPNQPETRVDGINLALTYDRSIDNGWSLDAQIMGFASAALTVARTTLEGSGRITPAEGEIGPVVGGNLRFEAQSLDPTNLALGRALGDAINGKATFFWEQGSPLRLPKLAVTGADYGIEAKGLIGGFVQGFPLSGSATLRADDLSRFAMLAKRPLSGRATGEIRGGGTLLAGSFDVTAGLLTENLAVGIAEADNLLKGNSTIDVSVMRDETGTLLRDLMVRAASLSMAAQGRLATAGNDLKADVEFTDLSALGGRYQGSLKGQATLTGTFEQAKITLNADGNALAIGQPQIDALLQGPSRLTVDAIATRGQIDLRDFRITAATLEATAQGQLSAADTDVAAKVAITDLAALGGGFSGSITTSALFRGGMKDGRLQLDGVGDDLSLGIPQIDRLLEGETDISANLIVQDGTARVEDARLTNPQLQASASGTAELLAINGRLANLAVVLPEFPGPVTVSGKAAATGTNYQVELTGTGPGQIAARVGGTVAANFQTANLTIGGSAQAGLADVFIGPRSIDGPVRFDLRLIGPLAMSSLSGRATLAGGRFSDPNLPFSLQEVTASADLSGGRAQTTFSTGLTTGGTVDGGGSVGLAAPYPADLTATFTQVIVRDPRLYETRMNGDVAVNGGLATGAVISGRLTLNETELRIPSTGLGANGLLPTLEHVAEPPDVRETRARAGLVERSGTAPARESVQPFGLDLLISAPARVFVRGRGLDAELGGELRLGGTTANVQALGGFELIRGRLDILGKRFVLSRARLQLEGNFDPRLDVLASTESDGITSSVQISGLASAPDVSFVSSPDLPEEEVLSRLLFGRGLAQLSPLQAVQLAGAVATLAGRGGIGIIGRLRQGIGLDNLDFESSEESGTTVTVGKYLSRNLYTEVIVGDDGKSEIQLNLDVTDSVTVRGRLGADGNTGLGLFLEKDY